MKPISFGNKILCKTVASIFLSVVHIISCIIMYHLYIYIYIYTYILHHFAFIFCIISNVLYSHKSPKVSSWFQHFPSLAFIQDGGIRGVFWSDPCFSSRYVVCSFAETFKTLDRSTKMLNAAFEDKSMNLFGLLGVFVLHFMKHT